jgi:hypothetical protein
MRLLFLLSLGIVLLFGCSETDDIGNLTVTASSASASIGETVSFTVKTQAGVDVTTQSKISVNGVVIKGVSYTFSTTGSNTIQASYGGKDSAPLTMMITDFPQSSESFVKRVLIEDITGAWCGWCPRVAYAIEQLSKETKLFVPVAIHNGSDPSEGGAVDPFAFNSAELTKSFDFQGFPTALVDRSTQWNFPEPDNLDQPQSLTLLKAPLGLALSSSAKGNDISLSVKIKSVGNFSGLKLVVYVLEDNLIYDQQNYTSYYNGDHVIKNFVYNDVLRSVLTNSILGDAISDVKAGSEITKTFSYSLPSDYQKDKIHFVAFILDSTKKALNARNADLNEMQSYEIQ